MPVIQLVNTVRAPIEVCFDLSRSIDFHVESMRHTGETAVRGKTTGLIGLGEEVTWRARHLISQELTARITLYDRPRHFRDSMVAGAFKRFDHDHYFVAEGENTVVTDIFDFESPMGRLGRIADELFLRKYMKQLLEARNAVLKSTAESEQLWTHFLLRS